MEKKNKNSNTYSHPFAKTAAKQPTKCKFSGKDCDSHCNRCKESFRVIGSRKIQEFDQETKRPKRQFRLRQLWR